MTFHLFQRTITRKGKKIKAWYYWYYDKQGKQVRKSCGTDGKPCLLKRDAEQFIESLKEKKELDNQKTFKEYCVNFYTPNSRFIRKREARGYIFHDNTMYQKNLYLNRFLEAFGDTKVRDLTPGDVENWLIELPGSNSAKNHILAVISEVEEELYCDHLIDYEIHIRRFRRNTQQKGILTLQEIRDLFPVEYDDLIKVWRLRGTDKESEIYSFATMIYTILTTGMRSSEIRALQWNQFVRPDAILINAMFDSNCERVNRLKKWNQEDHKWRVTVLPDRTVKMIDILRLDKGNSEFVFLYNNKPLSTWYLLDHFKNVLKKNGIDWEKRNITVHSLRFTYNTMLKGEISSDDLRLMVGHTSERMTDYYDRSKAIEHMDKLLMNKETINSIFN